MKKVDFRSDTVTKPSREMRTFMAEAAVGDDVFGDDPTINELQNFAADMFGKEAGLFCSSGTMTNQIAINVHTQPGDEVICHEEAHIYRYEGGGIAKNSGASVRFIRGNQGRINPDEIIDNINPMDDPHYPRTAMVSIEDTANRGGGLCYNFEDIKTIAEICRREKLILHLDGARVFNALQVSGVDPKLYGEQFDTLSICLSKGLGAPVGSLLLGSKLFIDKARRVRKVFGGGMRQAGIIAAGGLFALKNNIERLKVDHDHAKRVGEILSKQAWVDKVLPVQTNIVVGVLQPGICERTIVNQLADRGILCVPFGKGRVRFTTHLDISMKDIEFLEKHIS
ncbi:threonine aldolase family protein [Crocinitomix algicola]|uniref:threonine aldolase family protein n=1 Tax=Crocinitomix algicola TaxID=1740263 RepID=UPI00083550D0|nr:GntG family PLP-dependent aldolase [Crocinitomix algicola]